MACELDQLRLISLINLSNRKQVRHQVIKWCLMARLLSFGIGITIWGTIGYFMGSGVDTAITVAEFISAVLIASLTLEAAFSLVSNTDLDAIAPLLAVFASSALIVLSLLPDGHLSGVFMAFLLGLASVWIFLLVPRILSFLKEHADSFWYIPLIPLGLIGIPRILNQLAETAEKRIVTLYPGWKDANGVPIVRLCAFGILEINHQDLPIFANPAPAFGQNQLITYAELEDHKESIVTRGIAAFKAWAVQQQLMRCGISIPLQSGIKPANRTFQATPLGFLSMTTVWIAFIYVPQDPSPFYLAATIYLVESLYVSNTIRFLWNLSRVEDILAYVARIRGAVPIVGFGCRCYHFERRQVQVPETYTEYENQYNASTSSYEYRPVTKTRYVTEWQDVEVETHREKQLYIPEGWEDTSASLTDGLMRYDAVCVDFTSDFGFKSDGAKKRFEEFRSLFIQANQSRDTHFQHWDLYDLPGYKPRALSIVSMAKKPFLMHWLPYLLSVLLGAAWIYRYWFDNKTAVGAYHFRHLISEGAIKAHQLS